MSVTELSFLPLRPGVSLEIDGGDTSKKLEEARNLTASTSGLQEVFSGQTVENKDVAVTARVWESLEAQKANATSETRTKIREILTPLLAGLPTTFTIAGSSADLLAPLKAPVTEVFQTYFDAEKSDSIANQVTTASAAFLKALLTLPGAVAASDGWSTEAIEKDGKKVKVFALIIGWESVDAHMKARDTSVFAENIHLMRGGDPLGTSMAHIPFQK